MARRSVTVPLTLMLMSSLASSASGGGTLDAGVLFVHVDDRFGDDCSVPIAGFCFFTMEHVDSPGDLSIDAYQRLNYVGVATNFSTFQHYAGDHWLLPDQAVTLRTSDVYVPHPFFIILTEMWQETDRPEETDALQFSEDNFTLTHPYVSWDELGTIEPTTWTFVYGGWFGFDRLGPFDRQAGNSTDNYYLAIERGLCTDENGDWGCNSERTALLSQYYELTPNVNAGIELHNFQVATNPANLTPPAYPQALSSQDFTANATRFKIMEPEMEEEAPAPAKERSALEDAPPPAGKSDPPSPGPPKPHAKLQTLQLQTPPPPDKTLKLLLGATAVTALLAALGFALYSRIHTRTQALQSEARKRLLALIREKPGICLAEAATALGVARNAILHHVRILEQVQLVHATIEGGMRTLYPAGAQASVLPAWLRRNDACLAIMNMIQNAAAGLPREEVHRLLPEVPERTRNYYLKRLLAAGAIVQVRTPDGRKRLRIAEPAPTSR